MPQSPNPSQRTIDAAYEEVVRLRELIRDQNALARANADLRDKLKRGKQQRKELQARDAEMRSQFSALRDALYTEEQQHTLRQPDGGMLICDADPPLEYDELQQLIARATFLLEFEREDESRALMDLLDEFPRET